MKARAGVESVQEFIQSLPEERRGIVAKLHATIRKAAPKLKPALWNRMIGYGNYHYKYASGREGDWFVVGLASQKNYLSLYLCVCDGDGYLAEKNKGRLGKVSVGKSCIRFKKLEDLDLKVLIELIQRAEVLSRKAGGFAM